MHHLEHDVHPFPRPVVAARPAPDSVLDAPDAPWTHAQAAAVAAAEAIAAEAAAEVAAEAAATARAAVAVAAAAAVRAAAKAEDVAARALLVAAAAGLDAPARRPVGQQPERIAGQVAAVAATAAAAAVRAADVIREQLVRDESVLALQLLGGAVGGDLSRPLSAGVPDPVRVAEELRHGISTGQLRLHYQPILSLSTGQPVGVEALVRWQHPERGLLAPVHFIDVAEATGLVLPLGDWVLHEACRTAVALQGRSGTPLTVAVNLSGRQLSDRGLVQTIRTALDASGCEAAWLVFEVTETALVTDMGAAVDSLRALQRLGAGMALDDFGTGYAPLLYLKELAADDLKIDRSFVRGLGHDPYDTAIVAALISLAHNLNVRCVAEGVETVEQMHLLQQLGCDFAQGYLFCRPVDAAPLQEWLDAPREAVAGRHGLGRPAATR